LSSSSSSSFKPIKEITPQTSSTSSGVSEDTIKDWIKEAQKEKAIIKAEALFNKAENAIGPHLSNEKVYRKRIKELRKTIDQKVKGFNESVKSNLDAATSLFNNLKLQDASKKLDDFLKAHIQDGYKEGPLDQNLREKIQFSSTVEQIYLSFMKRIDAIDPALLRDNFTQTFQEARSKTLLLSPALVTKINELETQVNAKFNQKRDEVQKMFDSIEGYLNSYQYDQAQQNLHQVSNQVQKLNMPTIQSQIDQWAKKISINKELFSLLNVISQAYQAKNMTVVHDSLIQLENSANQQNFLLSETLRTEIAKHINSYNDIFNTYRNQILQQVQAVTPLIEQQQFKEAGELLAKIRLQAEQNGLMDLSKEIANRYKNLDHMKKLYDLLSLSKRVNIDDATAMLEISRGDFLQMMMTNKSLMGNFQLDGDYLVVKDDAKMGDFMSALDNQFVDWQQKEVTKVGKVEQMGDLDSLMGDLEKTQDLWKKKSDHSSNN
jgi:hypothetical protein